MAQLLGFIERVVFHQKEKNFAEILIRIDDKEQNKIRGLGVINNIQQGRLYQFYGEYYIDEEGHYFYIMDSIIIAKESKETIIRFLTCARFPTINRANALKIYDTFSEQCLYKIKEDNSLLDLFNINKEKKKIIIDGLNTDLDFALSLLSKYGFSNFECEQMGIIYGYKMFEIIAANPFILSIDLPQVDFESIDLLAQDLGFTPLCLERLEAKIYQYLYALLNKTGSIYCDNFYFISSLYSNTGDVDPALLEQAIRQLIDKGMFILESNKLSIAPYYWAETLSAEGLAEFISNASLIEKNDIYLDKIEQLKNTNAYSASQIEVIEGIFEHPFSIITGGPGVGKTHIVKGIIDILKTIDPNLEINLAASTGRASKVLENMTGHPCITLHRLLKYDLERNTFRTGSSDPLTGNVVIVDEASMIDIELFSALIGACRNYNYIILVGDFNQLPSVGVGNVLADLVSSGVVPVYFLKQIYRQKESSLIIDLAYSILNKEVSLTNFDRSNVSFTQLGKTKIVDKIIEIITYYNRLGFKEDDIQVLSPQIRGKCGIDNLNEKLRQYYNPASEDKTEIRYKNRLFREKDKILQLKNRADRDIYNGDIGYIEKIILPSEDEEGKIIANFNGEQVLIEEYYFPTITHGYAITVHKSQGNEYPIVIMPFSKEHERMLRPKLVYTMATRAREKLHLLGDFKVFSSAVNGIDLVRKTSLAERLIELKKEKV